MFMGADAFGKVIEGKKQLIKERMDSRKVLEQGSIFTNKGRDALHQRVEEMTAMGISPGGSADLMAITVGCYLVEICRPRLSPTRPGVPLAGSTEFPGHAGAQNP